MTVIDLARTTTASPHAPDPRRVSPLWLAVPAFAAWVALIAVVLG